jgi:hypothetical protein
MGMVQIGNPNASLGKRQKPRGNFCSHYKPMGNCEPWNPVVLQHSGTSILLAAYVYDQDHA